MERDADAEQEDVGRDAATADTVSEMGRGAEAAEQHDANIFDGVGCDARPFEGVRTVVGYDAAGVGCGE